MHELPREDDLQATCPRGSQLAGASIARISDNRGASIGNLRDLSEVGPTSPLSTGIGVGDASHNGRPNDIACATCHREHHGAQFNLTAMDNVACQSCHQQRYESLATDHPDFGIWPYERRTRIVFNHASHSGKHFAEKKQAFDCRTCHVSDTSGRVEQAGEL